MFKMPSFKRQSFPNHFWISDLGIRICMLSAVTLLAVGQSARSIGFVCCNKGIHCICPPPECCPDCTPCEGHHFRYPGQAERAETYIKQLQCECCCDRIEAARKFWHRWNGDVCCDPAVEPALLHALLCDTCWEVRRAAASALLFQHDNQPQAVVALFVSNKLDHHYMVRTKSGEALDIVLLCRRACFKDLFGDMGKQLLAALAKAGFRPGTANCMFIMDQCTAACGIAQEPAALPSQQLPVPEPLPSLPRPAK
jgi:HEAT repeat